ncbi:MAG: YrhB domain-containing protein [Candidatus Rokuibacteriota bacterium]
MNEKAVRRAKRLLGAATEAEVVRLAVERVSEMEEFWRFMCRSRGTLRRGSLRAP